ncbi:hypothetical protein GCM10008107_31440 [Psychrosphaera saromensis]|uniref:Uncharacterized protein n=1 Tax=Psychrosphaera saromensis TaxID=716813 RepID=A0A2S7UW15_9GAMM|nr:hypothetical protein [Psychrosphaera saromensis]PQJ53938.1 hypothetical protein BTO11_09880 [Psychrosphaera saromensis]GHB79624.1 hypothetical protein GCM10008107_31440 [Psychrosphaera saromensis]GLQ15252.1 hypothetical protein GCM10007917_27070 [Psychrosphaera saromensis]
MNTYSKKDNEYQDNGHYIVHGIHYMSLYTYRNIHGLPRVSPEINKKIGLSINPLLCEHIETLPDEGHFKIIKAYNLSYLKEHESNLFDI